LAAANDLVRQYPGLAADYCSVFDFAMVAQTGLAAEGHIPSNHG
jgi:hypothetical protein